MWACLEIRVYNLTLGESTLTNFIKFSLSLSWLQGSEKYDFYVFYVLWFFSWQKPKMDQVGQETKKIIMQCVVAGIGDLF